MRLHLILGTIFSLIYTITFSQNNPSLSYYLPDNSTYNPKIPTPQSSIGYIPGKWHVTHDKLINYMKVLANASPRITIEERGKTFEDRPIILLTITSEKNHANLEEIKTNHNKLTQDDASTVSIENLPAIVYQGFSIHGNEPSGSNASLLTAYHLAAAQGPEIEELLDSVVILFDPSLNPDGLQRFAYWANTNKSKNINTDPQDREYHEIWPGGRTNHYWFDMNRDWLPVQLPESRARIKTFHEWYPNILTDHHEMGSNSTFFFQPGIPSRTHPLTPPLNQKLTKKIAQYHANAFDTIGSLYYTEENFDDFYYGKGSTFPDINGGIGILFEQGSSRGHAQKTDNGILTFPFTIRNQFTATLSTLEAAKKMRKELLSYKKDFFANARNEALNDCYVFGNTRDAAVSYHLAEILQRHKISIHQLKQDITVDGKKFKKGYSYIVPKKQRQYRLLQAMFEKRTSFEDSLFYDISAWTFPLAFNLEYTDNVSTSNIGKEVTALKHRTTQPIAKSKYAYLMQWHEYYSPSALYQILSKKIRAKVGMQPFSLGEQEYDYGTILIPVQNQHMDTEELYTFLQEIASNNHIDITGVSTGLTTKGIDLGSSLFKPLTMPKIALITGTGITPYDCGEIWHLLDQRYNIPITKLTTSTILKADLSRYTHLILPNSAPRSLGNREAKKLTKWVQNGGILIGYRNAAQFFKNNQLMNLEFVTSTHVAQNISFEQKNKFYDAQRIGGAIFEAEQDQSHPINFGYSRNKISLFRNTTIFVKADEQSYNNPIQYTKNPLRSGYISKKNLDALSNTVPFVHKRLGRGDVILFTDNTNFRAFWYGTNKLLMNAIFFGNEM